MKLRLLLLFVTLMGSAVAFAQTEAKQEVKQEVKPTTIMAVGDSITEGSNAFESYTSPLSELLYEQGYKVEFIGPKSKTYRLGEVRNCGYSGRTVEFLESQIDKLYRLYPADIVLLHAAHNHFADQNPVEGMIEAHRSLIEKILAINPDAQIVVAQAITSGKLPKYSYIPALNKALKRMVREFSSKNVSLVNQAKGFDWQIHTMPDKVHPNKAGAQHMAQCWMKSLRRILPRP